MDDFQYRLLKALERLAGHGNDEPSALGVRLAALEGSVNDFAAVAGSRLDALTEVLQEIRDRLAAIHEDMPGGGGPP